MKFSWKNILPHLIAIGIFLLITLFYCKPALQGKVLEQHDLQQWQGMSKSSFDYKETHGHFPLWVNSMFGGMPGYQIAMDSKNPISIGFIHSIFTLFLPEPFSFFFLMCISFYFLSQVLKVDYRLGILGGIAYAYASFTPIIVTVGHVTQAMALGYMPAMLAAMFLVYQKKYWTGAALCTILAGLFVAQNHLQVTYYFIIIATIATIAYSIKWIREKDFKHLLLSYGIFAFAAIVGFAINMVTLATTYDFGQATMRGGSALMDTTNNDAKKSAGLPIDYAFGWSYGQAETFSMLVPNIYGGVSGGTELDASSNFIKQLTEKTGADADQVSQFASQFPLYWGDQPFTSGPVYLGAIICLLFVLGIIYLKAYDKWWMLIACALAILMSWGKNFMGFNEFLFNYLPLYNKFRVPTMTLVIPQLLFPLMGVLALQQFAFAEKDNVAATKKLKITGYVMLGLFAIVGMMYMSFDYKGSGDGQITQTLSQLAQGDKDAANSFYNAFKLDRQSLFGKDILRSLLFAGAAFLVLWLFVKNKIKALQAVIALLVLASADVIEEGRRYMNDSSFQEKTNADETVFAPTTADQQIMRDTGYYRVFNISRDYFNDALTSYFHNSVGGYSPVKLSITEDLLNFQLRKQPPNFQVLNMLNAKYFIVPAGQQGQTMAQQNPEALGNCWFVKAIEYKKTPLEVMKAMDTFNPRDTAIVEEASKSKIPFAPAADSLANIRLIKNDNDIITYESNSSANQFAVFSEIYYDRGWKAYIDDKEAPIVQTNYVLRGVAVPAGKHNIRFEFKPDSYYSSSRFAIAGSALAWLTVIGAVFFEWRNRKKKMLQKV